MKMKRYLSLIMALNMIAVVSCTDEDLMTPDRAAASTSAYEFVPNEVLVKFKSGAVSGARASSILSRVDAEVIETVVIADARPGSAGRSGIEGGNLVLAVSKLGTMEAIARLKQLPEVEYAEPNFIYRHFGGSNDPFYVNGSLWGMYGDGTTPSNAYGSQAGESWPTTSGSEVWVGIIDEGYMFSHEDLSANAGKNPGEIEGNGSDDDGNGYIDDVYGWDFDGNDDTIFDGLNDDHGTHVAGTIGAEGNNGKGVAGVIWNVRLMSAKFLGKRGGTTANAIKAVDYFTNLKINGGFNIVATNNSWGGGGFSQGLKDAITRAGAANILFVAAAGNNGMNIDESPSYPASYDNSNIIAVASIDSKGALSSFSNWGQTTVDLGAPGSGIYSTVPRRSGRNIVAGYAGYSGTSMATPHVTGAVALYASTHPGASAAGIKDAVLRSSTATTSLNNKCSTNGRLNVSALIIEPM